MLLFSNKAESEGLAAAAATSDRRIRSLAKAVSWRVTGSIDTILLSWLFTSDLSIAAAIGLTEVLTKMVLYYGHERLWNRISLGTSVTRTTAVDRMNRAAHLASSTPTPASRDDSSIRPAPGTERGLV